MVDEAGSNRQFMKRYLPGPLYVIRQILRSNIAVFKLIFSSSSSRISRAFSERLNLSVCSVNECVYCTHLHTKTALKAGVSGEQAADILSGEMGSLPAEESRAIAFARYWADQELLNPTDFGLYRQVAGQLLRAARPFDVIVYLHGPVDLLVERLRNRRDSAFNERVEKMVRALQPLYDEWIENLGAPLIRFPIDENDVKGEDGERVLAGLVAAIERFRFPLFGEQSG